MRRIFLRGLNAPGLVLLSALAIAIQTSVFAGPFLRYFQPDALLILVLWCALKRSFAEGGILTLIFGNLAEIHSAAPQGLYMALGMLVFLSVRAASRLVVIQNRLHWLLLSLISIVLHRIGLWSLLAALDSPPQRIFQQLILFFPTLGAQSLLAYAAFPWLERYDTITYKSPQAQRLLEDELNLEGEGI